jgi:hypothetical protein
MAHEVRVVKSLHFPVRDTRERATGIFVSRAKLPHGVPYVSPLPPALYFPRAPRLQAASSREIAYIQAGKCGSQIGTKFLRWCATNGFRGDGEYYGANGEQFDRINMFYNEASVGKYVPRAALFDLEPSVIDAERASPLGELICPGNFDNRNFGADKNWAKGLASTQSLGKISA